ncbi:MAG: cation diffusion facilitator family transporter [Gaiellaceae bacterium]
MHHHGHDHALDERLRSDRRALGIALALILGLMAAEVAFGLVASSLALLADAGHMLTDAFALGFALVAASLARRPPGGVWTFGFRRVEVLAALVNGILLGLVAVWILVEAILRLIDPSAVRGGIVLVVALVGVAVNLAAAAVLRGGSRQSMNVRAAFLHVATDLAAFAGTAFAGLLILLFGWDRFDPLASIGVAGLMLWSGWRLVRVSTEVFLERAPAGIDPEEIGRALVAEPGVVEVHDLHVWTVTSGFPALSAHVLVEADADCHGLRRELEQMLAERFGLLHTTLQVEHRPLVELGVAVRRVAPLD